MKLFTWTVFAVMFSLSCVHGVNEHESSQLDHDKHSDTDDRHPISQNVKIGEGLLANRYSDIYFSSQPSDENLMELKEQGFSAVINLRQAKEDRYEEQAERRLVESAGLAYENVPFGKSEPLSDELIEKVTAAVKKNRGSGKILIHCSSGNRVGMWLAGHFYKDHGFSKEESLQLAQKLGLDDDSAIDRAKDYLDIPKD